LPPSWLLSRRDARMQAAAPDLGARLFGEAAEAMSGFVMART
jgi:hypothetical protein